MTCKERILATLHGKDVDAVPFIPRLDIWYNANRVNNTLPEKYRHASLRQITDEFGWGTHAIVPDFRDLCEHGGADIGLGLYHLKKAPWRVNLHNVQREHIDCGNGKIKTIYTTPKGKLETTVAYDDRAKAAGLTLRTITEHAIKTYKDYEAAAYIFENAEVVPCYDAFQAYQNEAVGDDGIFAALSAMFVCPMHYLIKELMAIDSFYYETLDYPDETEALCTKVQPFCDKLFDAALNSSAEVILSGANYDSSWTAPSLFHSSITPALKRQSALVHEKNKFLVTHTDGNNFGLLNEYVDSDIDIADSICPAPMTPVSLAQTREVFGEKITIWGGIPSISLLENTMSDKEFESLLDQLMLDIGNGRKFIASVADTVPPAAKFDRLVMIHKKCRDFGPVLYDESS
jgi:uroporphyrinogen-III decarboxylase